MTVGDNLKSPNRLFLIILSPPVAVQEIEGNSLDNVSLARRSEILESTECWLVWSEQSVLVKESIVIGISATIRMIENGIELSIVAFWQDCEGNWKLLSNPLPAKFWIGLNGSSFISFFLALPSVSNPNLWFSNLCARISGCCRLPYPGVAERRPKIGVWNRGQGEEKWHKRRTVKANSKFGGKWISRSDRCR
jgi:hypothetical protein